MEMQANDERCLIASQESVLFSDADMSKVRFMIGSRFRKATKGRFFGFAWLVLDPLIISLIYFFVFSVVKANPNAASILLGVTLYRVFQSSVIAGIGCVDDLNGGLKCERVRTKVILLAEIIYRTIDSFLQSFLIVCIVVLAFDVPILGGVTMLVVAQITGIVFFGVGTSLAPLVKRVPDLKNVISYGLRMGFYASPAMYPMSLMSGLHYQINLFNPFAYLAETVREAAELESAFQAMNQNLILGMTVTIVSLALIGVRGVDSLRWRMTTWS